MAENTLVPVHHYLLSPLPWHPSSVRSRESQEDNLQPWCLLYLQLSDNRAAPWVCGLMQGKEDLGFMFLPLHPCSYPFLP